MRIGAEVNQVSDVPPCPRCNEKVALEVRHWPDASNYTGKVCCLRCRSLYSFELAREALDTSELVCPHCGCNDVQVTRWPGEGCGWWGKEAGKAKCQYCDREFRIEYIPPEKEGGGESQ